MRTVLILLRKDFTHFFRDRTSVVLTFVVPFALIYLFGQIFGVNRTDPGPSAVPLAVVDASSSDAGARLVDALRREKSFDVITTVPDGRDGTRPLAEADLRPLMRKDKFRFAVVLPGDFLSSGHLGLHLKLLSDPRNQIETQTVTGLLEKTLFTEAPQWLGQAMQNRAREAVGDARLHAFDRKLAEAQAAAFGGDAEQIDRDIEAGDLGWGKTPASSGSGSADDVLAHLVKIDREQVAGADVGSPLATQMVGGWAMQFLLFALVASATSLFHERDLGIFQRILSGPVSRSGILWSKFLYGVALGILQLVILFLAGRILFGIEVGTRLPQLVVVCAFAAAACAAFGMVLASVSRTPEAARGLATFAILLMSALGGAWFPVSFMPAFMQHFSRLTLVYWSIEGFVQVLWVHAGFLELLPTLAILGGIAVALFSIAWWRFQRGPIFD
jgi:ABC-2 type transport system permease protein